MESIIWLVIAAGLAVLVWLAAPYHQRIIERRELPKRETWD
jgi:hypothetical protein